MKRTLTLALGVVLGAAFAAPAFAQEGFPDTPENHWAFEAVAKMKAAGLLTGYPDGMFRGGRPASRYELAVALYALYQHLSKMNDSMSKSIKDLEEKLGGNGPDTSGFATKAELQAVKDQLNSMKSGLDSMRGWGDEIANFKKNLDSLKGDLASMGADVEGLKKGLGDLDARVKKLEGMKMPVEISGDLNLWLGAGYSDDRRFGITVDGRPTGVSRDDERPTDGTKDLTVLHEAGITLKGTNEEGPKWKATLVNGNMFDNYSMYRSSFSNPQPFGNQNSIMTGVPFGEGSGDTYIQNLEVMYSTSLLGQKFDMRAGRISKKTGAYFFQRQDTTPYFKNDRWDNHEFVFDGADFMFNFGSASLNIFGGRDENVLTNSGSQINSMWAGQVGHIFTPGGVSDGASSERPRGWVNNGISVDQHLGAKISVPLMNNGGLNLQYLILDSNYNSNYGGSPSMILNRVVVFGGDVNFKFGQFAVDAGYSQSNMNRDSHTVIDEDNSAMWANVSYQKEKWGVKGGYKQILPQFGAPGDWGRIGIWWNPTDIEGFHVGGWINLTEKVMLHAKGEFYQGTGTQINGITGMNTNDKINRYTAGLNFKFAENWNAMLGAEFVEWNLKSRQDDGGFAGGKPTERWYNVGFGYTMSDRASLSFLWQISDYDSKNVSGFRPFSSSSQTRATGGLLTSQLSIRF